MCDGGHAWQGMCGWGGMCCGMVCMAGKCVTGGMHGRGASMVGSALHGGHLWQESVDGRGDGHCSGQYASHWNAFLLKAYELIDLNHSCAI